MDELVNRGYFALGTAQWGMPYGVANQEGQPSKTLLREMLEIAQDAGIDTLDTAQAYGDSETLLGELTSSAESWRIITKISPDFLQEAECPAEARVRAREAGKASRAALPRDRLDAVLLHRAEHRFAFDGAFWEGLVQCRNDGIVDALGVSALTPLEAFEAIGDPEVNILQVPSSLLDQQLVRRGFFERAVSKGVQIYIRSVFLQGVPFLDLNALPAHLMPLKPTLTAIAGWAQRHDVSTLSAFLLFVRDLLPGVPVLGCESTEQLQQNINAWNLPKWSKEKLEELAALVPPFKEDILNPALWRA